MPDEELSPEEQTALAEMENETPDEPVTDGETKDEAGDADPPAGEAREPEFKSTREKDDKPPEGYVPHQAMHAERVKRQEVERRLADLEARLAKEDAPKDPEWVDPLVDPDGFKRWSDWRDEQNRQPIEDLRKQLGEQARMQERVQKVQHYESQFKATGVDDYDAAVQHMQTRRVNELRGMGYDDSQIGAQLSKDVNQIFDAAEMIGMNPAQLAYMRAQELGWSKPQQQQADDGAKITALDNARKQTQGLGATGAPQSGKPTAAQIAEMSEAEIARLSDDDLKAAFGG